MTDHNEDIAWLKSQLALVRSEVLVFLFITILLCILCWLLSRRQRNDKNDLLERISQTRFDVEQRLIAGFDKQTQLMESQTQDLDDQQKTRQRMPAEPDHALAIKLADEINLIERNISLMDPKTRGLKQLTASITKLRDNLAANNYEMPVLLGKPYYSGMKVVVTSSIADENLRNGEAVISKIIKPQVNFNDRMIQAAQIEVSVGSE